MANEFVYCPKCGEMNLIVNSNCQKCSEPLEEAFQQPSRTEHQYAQPRYVPPYQPQPVPKRKQSGCLILILICAALFICLIISGFVFFGSDNAVIDNSDHISVTSETTVTSLTIVTDAQTELSEPNLYTAGETVDIGDFKVVLTSFYETNIIESNDQYIDDVTTQEKFLVIKAKFTNDDSISRTIYDTTLTIVDGKGKRYDASNDINIMSIFLDERIMSYREINPGMSISGTYVFEMPRNMDKYYIEFSSDIYDFYSNKSSVTVRLK